MWRCIGFTTLSLGLPHGRGLGGRPCRCPREGGALATLSLGLPPRPWRVALQMSRPCNVACGRGMAGPLQLPCRPLAELLPCPASEQAWTHLCCVTTCPPILETSRAN